MAAVKRGYRAAIGIVAVALLCACGSSHTTIPDGGDTGAETADAPRDLPLAELDCADCNGFCGDGKLRPGEQCDDGNKTAGDGCTPLCQVVEGWTCPTPGQPCQPL